MPNKGFFSALNASQKNLFISAKEALIKLSEDSGDSFSDIARTLKRISKNTPDVYWDAKEEELDDEESAFDLLILLEAIIQTNKLEVVKTNVGEIDPALVGWMREELFHLFKYQLPDYALPESLQERSEIEYTDYPNITHQKSATRPAYLDPSNPRYSAKLAAAVLAWEAMEDGSLHRGKMPQAAMKAWLEHNYVALNLAHKRGSKAHGHNAGDMNKTAIEEVAKICNWKVDGGPPPTPDA
ncbi:hypothetical protein RCH14_002251 [Massilia sp. MP_M2]|uniref:hypothetical protein n=1 Tax=Massilia sp. MP_M2 TaxID=3071713 RepID=UPI00319E736D